MERELRLNDVIRRGFVKSSDGFLQLRVSVEAVSLKDGRRLAASNLSYDTVADYIFGTVESRLKSGCMPEAGMLVMFVGIPILSAAWTPASFHFLQRFHNCTANKF
jgi:hypothetical protein